MVYKTDKERILKNIKIDKNGCWIWQKYCDRYGIIRKNKKNTKAHRIAYELFIGEIENNLFVLHKCDVPQCCNPEHLFLGTQSDNVRDAVKKGRHKIPICPPDKRAFGDKNGMRKHPECLRGEKNGRSKVSDKQREEIREMRRKRINAQFIANKFGLCLSQITRISKGIKVGRGKQVAPLKHKRIKT